MGRHYAQLIASTAMLLSITCANTAHAGWVQDPAGWKYYTEEDANYTGEWKWIDGNSDGVYECYYFGSDGYLLENTLTPDGYTVDSDGAWTENGEVQTITFNDDIVLGFYVDSEFHFVPVTSIDGDIYIYNDAYKHTGDKVYENSDAVLNVLSKDEFQVKQKNGGVELYKLMYNMEVLE